MEELWKTTENLIQGFQFPDPFRTHTHTHTHTISVCVSCTQHTKFVTVVSPRELYWHLKIILRNLNTINQAVKMDRRRYAKFRKHLLIEVFPVLQHLVSKAAMYGK